MPRIDEQRDKWAKSKEGVGRLDDFLIVTWFGLRGRNVQVIMCNGMKVVGK